MRTIKKGSLGGFFRVENQAGERKGVAAARLSDLQRTAVPSVKGFVRVLKTQKVVTTLIGCFKNWVATGMLNPAFSKGFERRRTSKIAQNFNIKICCFFGWI